MRGSRIFELCNGAVTESAQGLKYLELGTLYLGVSVGQQVKHCSR